MEPHIDDDAARLRGLFQEKATLSQLAFGERHGLGTQSMVSQYLLGRRPLNIDAAMKFAQGLGCAIDDISPSLARKINQARRYVLSETEGELSAEWPTASPEAREVARFALSEPGTPLPPWADNTMRKDINNMLYAASRWLREDQAHKKIAA